MGPSRDLAGFWPGAARQSPRLLRILRTPKVRNNLRAHEALAHPAVLNQWLMLNAIFIPLVVSAFGRSSAKGWPSTMK